MPKDQTTKQFRRGTKSCVECRQRKLKCNLSVDEDPPCRNCESRGRRCVSQAGMSRAHATTTVTSRDRIRQLESSVGALWTVVDELRAGLGHTPLDSEHKHGLQSNTIETDGDSDASETSPLHPPTHLQRLFDNGIFASCGNGDSTVGTPEKVSHARVNRARTKLQALLPPKEEAIVLLQASSSSVLTMSTMFPPSTIFQNVDEMLSQYDSLQHGDADVASVGALCIWLAISAQHVPGHSVQFAAGVSVAASSFVGRVTETFEEVIVNDHYLAGTVEGIEATILWIRLQMSSGDVRKLWLALRRLIALAELIRLPRSSAPAIAEATEAASSAAEDTKLGKLKAAAGVWQSILIIDRICSLMFGLPLGTAGHSLPLMQTQTYSSGGRVNRQSYLSHLANIATQVFENDEVHSMQLQDTELSDRVFRTDQELRHLRALTPDSWWLLSSESELSDHIIQFWHYYVTARTHLPLALRDTADSQCAYSFSACNEACRGLAVRYVGVRSVLPLTFFAGRVLELQAMTAAVFLLFSSHRQASNQSQLDVNRNEQPSTELVYRIVQMMDRVAEQGGAGVARQAAEATRHLGALLERPPEADAETMNLKIPMLGKIKVARRSKVDQVDARSRPTMDDRSRAQPSSNAAAVPYANDAQTLWQAQPADWTMDFLLDDFPLFPGDMLATDQWLSFDGSSMNGPVFAI